MEKCTLCPVECGANRLTGIGACGVDGLRVAKFYLHPFELTKQKVPFLKELRSYDKFYIKQGIHTYSRRIERIIRMLKKSGYEFVTFEQLVQIMDAER